MFYKKYSRKTRYNFLVFYCSTKYFNIYSIYNHVLLLNSNSYYSIHFYMFYPSIEFELNSARELISDDLLSIKLFGNSSWKYFCSISVAIPWIIFTFKMYPSIAMRFLFTQISLKGSFNPKKNPERGCFTYFSGTRILSLLLL